MYQIGEFVVYGNDGVCEVEEISEINIPGTKIKKNYYTLKPTHENGKVFIPVDTKVFMRPIATPQEIDKIIAEIHLADKIESHDKNPKVLQENCKKLLKNNQCVDSLNVMLNMIDKKNDLVNQGKKLGQIEDTILKKAKSVIEDEFSISLGIEKKNVEQYISDRFTAN